MKPRTGSLKKINKFDKTLTREKERENTQINKSKNE